MIEARWWLSFCDPDLPEGKQFLGACVVVADDIISAAQEAHRLKCNPGGEVAGLELPDRMPWPAKYVGVLMDKATIERIDAKVATEPPRGSAIN